MFIRMVPILLSVQRYSSRVGLRRHTRQSASVSRRLTRGQRLGLLTHAGVNKDSEGLVNEARKDPGFHLNLRVINMQFIANNMRLKINTTVPTILSQSERYGTAVHQKRIVTVYRAVFTRV